MMSTDIVKCMNYINIIIEPANTDSIIYFKFIGKNLLKY